jgi:hypothetical protein
VMNMNGIIVNGITLPQYLAEIQGNEFQELINVFEVGNNNAQSVRAIMNSGNQNEINQLIMGMMDIVDETIQEGEDKILEDITPDPNANVIEEGAGMSGGANMLDITSNRITYNIDLSSKQGFYNTSLPYYNAVNIRSYRIDGNTYAIRDVVNQWNIENPEWNRYYQETIIPKIISSMKTTNSNDTYRKLETFRNNMTKWADILVEYLDFATDDENYYPTAPNTPYDSDEDNEVQNPIYQEGAGMCGGKLGELTDPLTAVLYFLGAVVGIPLTTYTFDYLYNLYQSNRQIIDDAMTDTTGSVSDVDSVMGDEGAGRKKRKPRKKGGNLTPAQIEALKKKTEAMGFIPIDRVLPTGGIPSQANTPVPTHTPPPRSPTPVQRRRRKKN